MAENKETDYNEILKKKFELFEKMKDSRAESQINMKGADDTVEDLKFYNVMKQYHLFGKASAIDKDDEEDQLIIPAGSVVDLKNQTIVYDSKKHRVIEFIPLMLKPIRAFKSKKDNKLTCQSFDCKYPVYPSKANENSETCDDCPRVENSPHGRCSVIGRPIGIPMAEHDDNFMFFTKFRSRFAGLHKVILQKIQAIVEKKLMAGDDTFKDKNVTDFVVNMTVDSYQTDYGEQFSYNVGVVKAVDLDPDIKDKLESLQDLLLAEAEDYTAYRESKLNSNGYQNSNNSDESDALDDPDAFEG